MLLLLTFLVGFALGAVTIVLGEALGLLYLLNRMNRRIEEEERNATAPSLSDVGGDHRLSFPNKQGFIWILEIEKVSKSWLTDKGPIDQKRKKEILEVTPVRKHAKVKDQSLVLTESDNSVTEIQLKGCTIAAVSATSFSSRKWAKRYPIKVESKTSAIYHASKTFYIFLETSWEKESWCKALRLASCDDKAKLKWFAKVRLEFDSYLTALYKGYPSFMKPSIGLNAGAVNKSSKIDSSSSKVRQFLKKFAKKSSKSGVENTASWSSTSGREERKIFEKSRSLQESVSATGLVKSAPTGKEPRCSAEENMVGSSLSCSTHSGSRSNLSTISDVDSDEKTSSDEGTLCWNLIISRLFFDAKSNAQIKDSILARVQRTLSNMRSPSYIGEVTCTGIHHGNLPPYVHAMRILPSHMNEVVALELDIDYSGGAVLDIETRLEVRELNLQEGTNTNLESSSVGEVTADLLEGFEYYGKQLKLSDGTIAETEQQDEGDPKHGLLKSSNSTAEGSSSVSRWKSILNSIAKQVSQVPLSLGIRVASLRGTLRLHIKPPPSDQLWFGFTCMPDIDFNLESYVGDHKITSGHIALFLISRFKAVIRETMVLPNCESVCIPWMLAEKDDWIPRKLAPFMWINQDAVNDHTTVHEACTGDVTPVDEASSVTSNIYPESRHGKAKKDQCVREVTSDSLNSYANSLCPTNQSDSNEKPSDELRTPLLEGDEQEDSREWSKEENPECQSPSLSLILTEEHDRTMGGDDARLKRTGTRARVLGLGRKMGGKLEEKRRHIEEKGRNIVERMRGP